MTIQLQSREFGKSKATLAAALNASPASVWFYNPSIVCEGEFSGDEIKPHERFPIVMDPPKRQRFAEIWRRPDGTFRVL